MQLIHYGSSKFVRRKFLPVADGPESALNKPVGGLWTSPVDSEYGWIDWCKEASFSLAALKKSFVFTFTGNVVVIDSASDLDQLVWKSIMDGWDREFAHYAPLVERGVDAIHLTVRGQQKTRFSYPRSLYGWDCESVLVMNPDCVLNKRARPEYCTALPKT